MAEQLDTAQPSRATLVSWARLNVQLAVALFGLASGIMGAAVTTTARIVNTQNQLETLDARLDRFDKLADRRQTQWDEQWRTNADIDRRLVRLEARSGR